MVNAIAAARWIDDNFVFLIPNDDDLPNLDWVLNVCGMAVINADILICDPWNRLDHTRPANLSLTEHQAWAQQIIMEALASKIVTITAIRSAHPSRSPDPRWDQRPLRRLGNHKVPGLTPANRH